MSGRLAAIAARQPDRVLAAIAALALGCGFAVALGEERLVVGGAGARPAPLEIRISSLQPLRAAPNQVALDVIRARLLATDGVTGVEEPGPGAGGRTTTLVVGLSGDAGAGERAVSAIEAGLDPGPLQVSLSGGASELREARDAAAEDAVLLLLALPLAALLLAGAMGTRAALATAIAVAATVLGAGAVCVAVALVVDLSVLALIGAFAGGLPAAILLCGLVRQQAPARAVGAAALAAASVFAVLAGLGVDYLGAVALGGALATLLAAPTAIATIAAATALWRLDPGEEAWLGRALARLLDTTAWRRAVAVALALLALTALLVMTLPLTRIEPASLAAPEPPRVELWRVLGAAAAGLVAVLAVSLLAGGGPLRALMVVLTTPLAAAAAAGICVLAFEDGELGGILDFGEMPVGVAPLAAGAVAVAAASAAAGVAGLARSGIGEPLGGRAGWARATSAGALAGAVTAAAGAALLASSEGFVQVFGLLVLAGFALDVVLARGVLNAALLGLGSGRDG